MVAALRRLAPCAIEALLPDVYADVPQALHAMAQRSLLAHLLKLEGEGAAARDEVGGRAHWRLGAE